MRADLIDIIIFTVFISPFVLAVYYVVKTIQLPLDDRIYMYCTSREFAEDLSNSWAGADDIRECHRVLYGPAREEGLDALIEIFSESGPIE